MKTHYLDCFSGISGDMFLGLLIDLGLEPSRLEHELDKLQLPGWQLQINRQKGIRKDAPALLLYCIKLFSSQNSNSSSPRTRASPRCAARLTEDDPIPKNRLTNVPE